MLKPILSGLMLALALAAFTATITVDLNGHGNSGGTTLTSPIAADPGPGGLPAALTYTLPFTGIQAMCWYSIRTSDLPVISCGPMAMEP